MTTIIHIDNNIEEQKGIFKYDNTKDIRRKMKILVSILTIINNHHCQK